MWFGFSLSEEFFSKNDARGLSHVFVSATGTTHDDNLILSHRWSQLADIGERVGGLQSRDDALHPGDLLEGGERFVIGRVNVFALMRIGEPGVLRADRRVIETGRNGVSQLDLSICIGEQPGLRALQDAELAAGESCRVATGLDAFTPCFHTDFTHFFVSEKRVEQTDRVAATTDAGDEHVGQALLTLQDLLARLLTDNAVKIAHNHRKRVRSQGTAENIVSRAHKLMIMMENLCKSSTKTNR